MPPHYQTFSTGTGISEKKRHYFQLNYFYSLILTSPLKVYLSKPYNLDSLYVLTLILLKGTTRRNFHYSFCFVFCGKSPQESCIPFPPYHYFFASNSGIPSGFFHRLGVRGFTSMWYSYTLIDSYTETDQNFRPNMSFFFPDYYRWWAMLVLGQCC